MKSNHDNTKIKGYEINHRGNKTLETKKPAGSTLLIYLFIILLFSVLKGWPALNYSIWSVDEEQIIPRALGFLNYDFHPHWFGYHTLPMYLISIVYFILYPIYLLFDIVQSKVEFVSLLFSDDSIFFITARLLCSLAYTTGCLVITRIIIREYKSYTGAIIFFILALFLPDAVIASNYARVDTFVFLFLSLTIYFSCYNNKNLLNLILSIFFCAAAFASKIPAIVIAPILFLQISIDVYRGIYPKQYLLLPIFLFPLFVFFCMPYLFLDFAAYRILLNDIITRASGLHVHVGKTNLTTLTDRMYHIFLILKEQTGLFALSCSGLFIVLSPLLNKKAIVPSLYIIVYAASFLTSLTLDSYWFRPVFPFILFYMIIFFISVKNLVPSLRRDISIALFQGNPIKKLMFFIVIVLFLVVTPPGSQGLASFVGESLEHRQDTRVIASYWIQDNIPAKSIVFLEGFIQHYLPRVFSHAPQATLDNSFYNALGAITDNNLLTEGFYYYFDTHKEKNKKFIIALMMNNNWLKYDPPQMVIPKEAYVVISNAIYDRFNSIQVQQQTPQLAENATLFYSFIRKQKLIKSFQGRGPRIDIYQMQEGLNYP